MRITTAVRAVLCVGTLFALAYAASAQEGAPVTAAPLPATLLLPAGTEIHLRLLDPVASNTHKRGDRFQMEVVEPVVVEGTVIIPSGARGEGEVVHAAKSGFGGRAGELILVSRLVRVGEQSVKLRSFSAGSGQNRINLAMGLSYAVIGIFVTGKEISLPADTDVFAKVAEDLSLPAMLATGPVDGASPSLPDSTSTEIDHHEPSQQ